jgi:universal stress protein A
MTPFHHVLVPVDFEESSREALDVAIDLALAFEARLTVFHAWEIPTYAYTSMSYVPVDFWTPLEAAATQDLATTLALVRTRVPGAGSILAKGAPATEILGAVAQSKADLVVMGTHGRQGLGHALLGSVAEKVVRASPVPVLTIRCKRGV